MATKKLKLSIKTAYGTFLCAFEPERDMGGYVAEAPDIQGAVSWGRTLAEAKHMITEAVEGAIEARAIVHAEKEGAIRILKPARLKFKPTP